MRGSLPKLKEKLLEALKAVLPIIGIVVALCFSVAPISPSILLCFLLGAVMIVLGMMFFTLGAESSMTPMGERVGTAVTRSRNLAVIIGMGFLLGFLITISEPDLQVLAGQVPAVPNMVLILAVAAGVGLFLVLALLRMLFGVPLAPMLVFFYMIVFVLALFVPKDFLAVAFDPGGVTTGPMTATFLLPFAQGACAAVGGNIVTDAFGVVAMVAMTSLIAIQILGMVYQARQRSAAMSQPIPAGAAFEALDDDAIIEL